jgi:hypothetical protein
MTFSLIAYPFRDAAAIHALSFASTHAIDPHRLTAAERADFRDAFLGFPMPERTDDEARAT